MISQSVRIQWIWKKETFESNPGFFKFENLHYLIVLMTVECSCFILFFSYKRRMSIFTHFSQSTNAYLLTRHSLFLQIHPRIPLESSLVLMFDKHFETPGSLAQVHFPSLLAPIIICNSHLCYAFTYNPTYSKSKLNSLPNNSRGIDFATFIFSSSVIPKKESMMSKAN